ncbi:HAD family phosphatase [Mesorhizobium sp. CAU 1741]|uniref:HAD family hydrolase n=1 Tax=Mesorhizobium sp. CAU 1741 TaxID=3140366 RepID=UPI00325B0C3D
MASSPTHPRLVIFDCDGVLVNTEERANRVLSDWLTTAGHVASYEDCRRLYSGRSMKSVQAEIEEAGHVLGFDLTERWYAAIGDIFGAGVEAIPHVELVLDALRERDVAWCVASSAKVDKMHLTLGSTGLLPHFHSVLYSATMVERGKPFPDLFLHAATEMGFQPRDCVVIEDSVPGSRAGVAAGMQVYSYHADPHSDRDALAAAGGILFDDMRDLPRLLFG